MVSLVSLLDESLLIIVFLLYNREIPNGTGIFSVGKGERLGLYSVLG